jgi:hypothetical protein
MLKEPRKHLFAKGRVLVLSLVFSLLLVGASLVAPGLLGGSRTANVAHASGGGTPPSGTVTVASPVPISLARTSLLVSGTFSCTSGSEVFFVGELTVEITQAGRSIVQAINQPPMLVTACDQGVVPYQVVVTPFGGSPKFHGGSAVANATLTLNFESGAQVVASTGDQVIRIQG